MEKVSFHLLSFPLIYLLQRLCLVLQIRCIFTRMSRTYSIESKARTKSECMRKILVDRKRFYLRLVDAVESILLCGRQSKLYVVCV